MLSAQPPKKGFNTPEFKSVRQDFRARNLILGSKTFWGGGGGGDPEERIYRPEFKNVRWDCWRRNLILGSKTFCGYRTKSFQRGPPLPCTKSFHRGPSRNGVQNPILVQGYRTLYKTLYDEASCTRGLVQASVQGRLLRTAIWIHNP